MLDRAAEDRLLEFCVEQRDAFVVEKWQTVGNLAVNEQDLAVVALYLAGGDWYGHHPELAFVADKLRPGCVGHFAELVKETRFECGRFGNMLKMRLEEKK